MKKTIFSAILAVFTISVFSVASVAAPGDLFVTVDLDEDTDQPGCSILKVDPQGNLSIFLTDDEIRDATGLEAAVCDDSAIACDLNSEIYFTEKFNSGEEEEESRILRGGPTEGIVSLFTSNATIVDATGEEEGADLKKGMTFGPDGNLYATDDASDSVLQITVPGSEVSITVAEETIEALTGEDAELDGGVAIDPDFNIFVVENETDSVISCRPGGPCSFLTTEDQLADAAGIGSVNLNEAILLVDDVLYVAEDNDCNCVFVININTGVPQVFLSETQLESILDSDADPEGGLAVDEFGRIYVGNSNESFPGGSIVRTGANANVNQLSLFVNRNEVLALFSDNDSVEFDGGMCITPGPVVITRVPTLSEWSMIAMAGVLGVIGLLFAMRRRAFNA